MILLYCLAAILLLLALFWKYQARYLHLRKKFPYGAVHPIVQYLYRWPVSNGHIDFVAHLIEEYGDDPVLCFYINTCLVPTTPKLLAFVLGSTKTLNKADDYCYLRDWLGDGLLSSTADKWKSHRKILSPSFHFKTLEKYVNVFDSKSFVLVKKLRPYVGRDKVEIFENISLYTLDVICETAMGIEMNAQENSATAFVQSVKKIEHIVFQRLLTPLRNDLVFRFSSFYKPYKQSLNTLLDFSKNIVSMRKQALINNQETCEEDKCGIKMNRNTLLDTLLKLKINGRPFTEEEIREEVDTFIFAGHDTTAIATNFCLYLLSKHPEIQQRAYEEVISIIGKDKKLKTTYANLQDMKYLEQVIKESLRLYPPIWHFSRKLNEDVEYEGTVLPRGLQIPILPILIHRNPAYYPDPEKFDPERFTSDENAKRHPYVYLPFSAGPRNCIGQKFAMLELKCTISKLLRHYRILPAIPEHIVQLTCTVTLTSKNGVKIRLEERE